MSSAGGEYAASLPVELGCLLRRREGSARFCCDLIAAGPGHPSESERVIFDVLKGRHAAQPYDWVFMSYDASQKQGEFAMEGKELAIDPYRSFPDPEVTAGIAEAFVRDGMAASAWAFGVVSQPACHVLPLDDWYGWAISRDALRQLDAAAGRLAAAAGLLERTVRNYGGSSDPVRQLLDLVWLRWTGSQWLAGKDNVMALDVAGALVGRGAAGAEPLARLLSELRRLAADFYDASLRRTEAVVAGAIERMGQTGARHGAILIALPWIEQAEAALVAAGVGFDVVLPAKVAMRAMLDDVHLLLGAVDERHRPLNELFSGERVRTRIEALLEDRPDLAKARAQDWASASHGLVARYEIRFDVKDLKRAEECVGRALALDEAMDHAWWVKGEILTMQRKHEAALVTLDRALALAPRKAHYWRAKGAALDGLGRTHAARTHFIRAIHISPGEGPLWTFLGLHYHRHDRRAAACYCLGKGKEYHNQASRDNHRMLGCPEPRLWNCPFALLPVVIRAMNRVVLPLRYGWGHARMNAGLLAVAVFLVGAATWGTIVGAFAGGLSGGVVGFVAFLLAAAVAVALLLVTGVTASGARLSPRANAVVLAVAAGGAWLGASQGARVGTGTWRSIWAGAAGIAMGGLGAGAGTLAGAVLSQAASRRSSAQH